MSELYVLGGISFTCYWEDMKLVREDGKVFNLMWDEVEQGLKHRKEICEGVWMKVRNDELKLMYLDYLAEKILLEEE